MGLFDRRTPPQGSVLPTPHAPADTPLPVEEPGTDGAVAAAHAPETGYDVVTAPDALDVPELVDDDDDEDLVLTPVWPARPGGPHDPAAGADDLTPVAPPVPAALVRDEPGLVRDEPGPDEAPAEEGAGQAVVTEETAGQAVVTEETAGQAVLAEEPPTDDAPEARTDAAAPADAAPEPPATDLGHTVDELNPAERIWLAQQRTLVADLCDDPTDPAAVAALFDRVRTQWAQAAERPDHRPLADAFGVALGDLVVARAPALRWAAVSDRFGTEIALAHGEPEVLVYPLASVAQYWEDARPGWFTDQVERLVQTVRAALPAG